MVNPILTRTVAVPVGTTGARLDVSGKHVKIQSCTAASVLLGFDASTPERAFPDDRIATQGFQSLRFIDDIGAGSTVIVQISDEPIGGGMVAAVGPLGVLITASNALLTAIEADTTAMDTSLNNIETDVDNLATSTTHVNIARQVVAQTGVGDNTLVAANAANRHGNIQAAMGNAGLLYLSHTTPALAANAFAELQAGGSYPWSTTEAIYACSENGTEEALGVIRRA